MYLVFTGGCTFGGVSVPCIYCRMYFWPNVCTLCLLQDVILAECVYLVFTAGVSLVGLVYLVFTAGGIFGGVSVPCVYCRMYLWWS